MTCPYCGKPDILYSLKNNTHLNTLDLEEDTNNFKIDDNINKIIDSNFDFDSKNNERHDKNTSDQRSYSIDNFNFDIIARKNLSNYKNKKINKEENKTEKNNDKGGKKLGRKTKKEKEFYLEDDNPNNNIISKSKVHDKYADDNLRKKCKNLILKYLLEFINNKIKIMYKDDIGFGEYKKKLKILKQKGKKKETIYFYHEFIGKKLKDIFSQDISERFSNFSSDHNKKIIESLINEKDDEKRAYFTKLFEVKFIDCLKHFIGEKKLEELEGFKTLLNVKDLLLKLYEENYLKHIVYYMKNYEDIINKKFKDKNNLEYRRLKNN